MKERLKGEWLHRFVVLKHRVQADNSHIVPRERLADALCLGKAVRYAAGAEHLKGFERDDTPAQIL